MEIPATGEHSEYEHLPEEKKAALLTYLKATYKQLKRGKETECEALAFYFEQSDGGFFATLGDFKEQMLAAGFTPARQYSGKFAKEVVYSGKDYVPTGRKIWLDGDWTFRVALIPPCLAMVKNAQGVFRHCGRTPRLRNGCCKEHEYEDFYTHEERLARAELRYDSDVYTKQLWREFKATFKQESRLVVGR